MIACTSTASASRRKSTFPSTPRLRSSPRTSMLSLTTSSPPRASTVFAREDDAVVSLSLDLCYTTSWDSTFGLLAAACTGNQTFRMMTCEGTVRNLSPRTIEGVQVVVEWVDDQGAVQATDSQLIDYNPLLAGQ